MEILEQISLLCYPNLLLSTAGKLRQRSARIYLRNYQCMLPRNFTCILQALLACQASQETAPWSPTLSFKISPRQ